MDRNSRFHLRKNGKFAFLNGLSSQDTTLKTLLIHGADDRGNAGPDYTYGWGLINVLASAKVIQSYADNPANRRIIEAELEEGQTHIYQFAYDGNGEIRATLGWWDPPGVDNSSENDRTPDIINDLNVKVVGPTGVQHLPYVMPFVTSGFNEAYYNTPAERGTNTTDTVEMVLVAGPSETGIYTVQVDHSGTITDGPQKYTLILDGTNGETPLPTLSLNGVIPATGNTDSLEISVNGSGFLLGADVILVRDGSAPIPAYSQEVMPDRIDCRLDLASAEEGYWDLWIRNPNGSESLLENRFLVPSSSDPSALPPIFETEPPASTISAGTRFDYAIVVSDADTPVASLTLSASILPEWLTFSDEGNGTATLTGTPSTEHAGTSEIQLLVTDGTYLTRQVFELQIYSDTIAPEIDIRSDEGLSIPSGDSSPDLTDGTDFGITIVGQSPVNRTFTIHNNGALNLEVSAPTLGGHTGDFSIVSEPDTPLTPFSNTDFTVRFAPTAAGLRTATISIANNDPDESPYTFAVQGGGSVLGGGGPNLVFNPEFDDAIQTTELYWAKTWEDANIGWLQRDTSDNWTRDPGSDPFAIRTGNAFLNLVQIIDVSGQSGTFSLSYTAANNGSNDFELYIWGVNVDASVQLLDDTAPFERGTSNTTGDLLYSNTTLGATDLDWTTFEDTLDLGPTGYQHLIIKIYSKSITGSEFAAVDSFVIGGGGDYAAWASVFPWPNPGTDDLSEANPDGDSWPNVFERMFRLDPLASDSPVIHQAQIENGQFVFNVVYEPLDDTTIGFETSTNLIDWSAASPSSEDITPEGEWQRHELRFDPQVGETRLFLRMNATTLE